MISLLITTRNRTDLLERSLVALSRLTVPDEIVVVDDGGTDDCATRLGKIDLPIAYRWIDHPGDTNCCLARNVGIRTACGDEILVSEPEVVFLTDVVGQLLEAREEFPKNTLFGCTLKENAPAGDTTMVAQYPHYTLYKRDWLVDVGGYDERLPGAWGFEDVDLNHRLSEVGHFGLLISHCRALHQWHQPRIDAISADANEAIVRAKVWPQDIRANQGRGWGVV